MNLLMISGDRMAASGKQGAFWYTLEELSKHWDRIDVICPRLQYQNSKSETNSSQENFVKNTKSFSNVYFHPSSGSLLMQARWIEQRGAELIKDHHHSVMTVHEYPPFYNGIGARKLSKKTGVPHVLEVHHIVGCPKPASMSERVGYWLSKKYLPGAIKKAAAVRTVNEETKRVLVSMGADAKKIHVVPSFYLDSAVLHPDPHAEKKYDLVFCARLVANKGLPAVLEAVSKIPGIKLLVIGDGPERTSSMELTRSLGVDDRVTFTGWLPEREDVVHALQSSRVFIMNSSSEGGPRSALEAMACGIPVIATKVGVMPEVITEGKNGLFTTGEPDDLKQKIEQMMGHLPGIEETMKQATIMERFERKRLIGGYAEFLKKLPFFPNQR